MRMRTAWWGGQILAETIAEANILKKLVNFLPNGAERGFGDGSIKIIDATDEDQYSDYWGFNDEDVKGAKAVLEICR